jgi:hypothetical protein
MFFCNTKVVNKRWQTGISVNCGKCKSKYVIIIIEVLLDLSFFFFFQFSEALSLTFLHHQQVVGSVLLKEGMRYHKESLNISER